VPTIERPTEASVGVGTTPFHYSTCGEVVSMNDVIHAFPDTNVFLHYKPLAEIDWCGLLKARSVTLVICLPVIQELDNKKSDPRLADRARRAIKEIEEHESAARPLRPGVTLEISNEEIRRDEFPSSLSPDSQDDRIVHLARKYMIAHTEPKVCVLTEDYGMGLRCRVGGVAVERMQASDRLENPGEERDKKLKQVQGELAALKSRLPKLTVCAVTPDQPPTDEAPFRCVLTDAWVDLDVQVEIEKQRLKHPKRAERRPSPHRMMITEVFESHISAEDWEKFDSEIDSFLFNYEIYINNLNIWGSNNARTVRFDLWLLNSGNTPATDLDVHLLFPPKIRWVAESSSQGAQPLARPKAPSPPEPPKPRFLTELAHSYMGSFFGSRSWLDTANLPTIGRRDEPEVTVHLRANEGHVVHAKLDRLKHGQGVTLGTFLAVFGDWSEIAPFEVGYTISVTEHPEKISGTFPMIISMAGAS
jgi:hypothetical protein